MNDITNPYDSRNILRNPLYNMFRLMTDNGNPTNGIYFNCIAKEY